MAEYIDYGWRTSDIICDSANKTFYKNLTASDRQVAIKALRDAIRSCEDYEFKNNVEQDDRTLQKFLFARKFVLEDSFELLKNYYHYRSRNPDVFKNLTLEAGDIRKALENGKYLLSRCLLFKRVAERKYCNLNYDSLGKIKKQFKHINFDFVLFQ